METVRNIRNPIPTEMLQPSKWLSLYEDFVTKNASSVGQVESALRSLTYIIPGKSTIRLAVAKDVSSTRYLILLFFFAFPGRYRESEVASECGKSTAPRSYRVATELRRKDI